MQYMGTKSVIRTKETWPDGTIIEMVVWQLSKPVPGSAHFFKYRLYCGREGECVVRFDNESGKGDHRHLGQSEAPYAFESVTKLIEDFMADVRRLTQ